MHALTVSLSAHFPSYWKIADSHLPCKHGICPHPRPLEHSFFLYIVSHYPNNIKYWIAFWRNSQFLPPVQAWKQAVFSATHSYRKWKNTKIIIILTVFVRCCLWSDAMGVRSFIQQALALVQMPIIITRAPIFFLFVNKHHHHHLSNLLNSIRFCLQAFPMVQQFPHFRCIYCSVSVSAKRANTHAERRTDGTYPHRYIANRCYCRSTPTFSSVRPTTSKTKNAAHSKIWEWMYYIIIIPPKPPSAPVYVSANASANKCGVSIHTVCCI